MTWFKVDDGFCGNKKARRAGLSAVGLWTVAGSYSSQQLLDGFVPDWYVTSWPAGRKVAATLVTARLWTVAEHDGDQGWQFHDWEQCNPLRAKVEADREAAKRRMQDARSAKQTPTSSAHVRANTGRSSPTRSATPTRPVGEGRSLRSLPPPKTTEKEILEVEVKPTREEAR